MITKCVCHDILFAHLKKIADEQDSHSIEELQQHIEFGHQCRLCHPFVRRMLVTGRTEFSLLDADESEQG